MLYILSALILLINCQSNGQKFFEGFAFGVEYPIQNPSLCVSAEKLDLSIKNFEATYKVLKEGITLYSAEGTKQGLLRWSEAIRDMSKALLVCGAAPLAIDIERLATQISAVKGFIQLPTEEDERYLSTLFKAAIAILEEKDYLSSGIITGEIATMLLKVEFTQKQEAKKAIAEKQEEKQRKQDKYKHGKHGRNGKHDHDAHIDHDAHMNQHEKQVDQHQRHGKHGKHGKHGNKHEVHIEQINHEHEHNDGDEVHIEQINYEHEHNDDEAHIEQINPKHGKHGKHDKHEVHIDQINHEHNDDDEEVHIEQINPKHGKHGKHDKHEVHIEQINHEHEHNDDEVHIEQINPKHGKHGKHDKHEVHIEQIDHDHEKHDDDEAHIDQINQHRRHGKHGKHDKHEVHIEQINHEHEHNDDEAHIEQINPKHGKHDKHDAHIEHNEINHNNKKKGGIFEWLKSWFGGERDHKDHEGELGGDDHDRFERGDHWFGGDDHDRVGHRDHARELGRDERTWATSKSHEQPKNLRDLHIRENALNGAAQRRQLD